MKRSPVIGAATGLALSSVTLVGIALTPATLHAKAPAAAAVASTPAVAVETPKTYAYAGSLPTELDRNADRATRANRAVAAANAARASEAIRQAAAARAAVRAAEAARRRALAQRIFSGQASVPEIRRWTHNALTSRGWSDTQWSCLDSLWTLESSWDYRNTNESSGAYGIPQSLPADKMAATGSDWRTNIDTQIRWGLGYIADRYGTPCSAWSHSRSYNWY